MQKRFYAILLVFPLLFSICFAGEALASTYTVDNVANLQTAITDAASGDTIVLTDDLEGATLPAGDSNAGLTITKDLTFESRSGDSITLYPTSGSRHATVYGADVTLTFKNVILDGGHYEGNTSNLGGIVAGTSSYNCKITLVNAVVKNCYRGSTSNGAGITDVLSRKTDLYIIGGEISNNSAGFSGAGIYLSSTSNITVSDGTTISNNIARSTSSRGGGIYAANGKITVTDSIVTNNTANGSGGGISRYSDTSGDIEITDSTINGNTAPLGGGIYLQQGSLVVTNSTINNNNATTAIANAGGGGLLVEGTSTVEISGTEISGNTSTQKGGGIFIPELANLTVDATSRFSNNNASAGYAWIVNSAATSGDDYTHAQNIETASFTTPFTNAYNNYDVNYIPSGTTYAVTYNANEGTGEVPIDNVHYCENFPVTVAEKGSLSRSNYTFKGWKTEKDSSITQYTGGQTFMITNNVELYAAWKAYLCRVEYNSNGGSLIDAQEVEYGQTATRPKNPEKSGFIFDGWYTDDGIEWDFDTEITEDITLFAKWAQGDPSDPNKAEPADSTDPTDLADPADPIDPVNSSDSNIPKTGDNSNIWIPLIVAAVSVSIIALADFLFFFRARSARKQ